MGGLLSFFFLLSEMLTNGVASTQILGNFLFLKNLSISHDITLFFRDADILIGYKKISKSIKRIQLVRTTVVIEKNTIF